MPFIGQGELKCRIEMEQDRMERDQEPECRGETAKMQNPSQAPEEGVLEEEEVLEEGLP